MKVRFNFSLDGWMFAEVDGHSLEDCKDNLYQMTFEELLENGFMKSFDIKDLDHDILEVDYKIRVTAVDYVIDEDDLPDAVTKEDILSQLPQTFEFEITAKDDVDLEEQIEEKISDEVDWLFNNFTYEIIAEN